jgi:hypothetical protein
MGNFKYIIGFFLYILLQQYLFNSLTIFDIATPFIFLIYLLLLPLSIKFSWTIIIAFVMGLSIDLLSYSIPDGLHSFAAVAITGLRQSWIRVTNPTVNFSGKENFTFSQQSMNWFVIYLSPLLLFHHTIYFVLDAFSSPGFWWVILRIITSFIYTLLSSLVIVFLFYHKAKGYR